MGGHPAGPAAAANMAAADKMLNKAKSMLRREDGAEATSSGLTTPQIVGIAVGGGLFVVLSGWVIYKYMTWVPKTRAARAGALTGRTDSSPSSPSSADERKKLIVAK